MTLSFEQRFWSKVKIGLPDKCWEWQGAISSRGYGSFRRGDKICGAYRVSWELTYGIIPSGLCVCHKCDNPPCVNPNHLFLGTHQDNIKDRSLKGRSAKTIGKYSHEHPEKSRGERNGRAKLTERDVLSIRSKYASGEITQKELSNQYGVVHSVIGYIIHHKIWKHI
jgi:hypothetical protein